MVSVNKPAGVAPAAAAEPLPGGTLALIRVGQALRLTAFSKGASGKPQAVHGGTVWVLPSPSSTCMLCFTTMGLLQELAAVQDLIWTMGQQCTR